MQAQFNEYPDIIFKREGNSLRETTIGAPGQEFDVIFVLNEMKDWKEGDTFHVHVLALILFLHIKNK